MYDELAILALFVFLYSLIAGRIERSAAASPPIARYFSDDLDLAAWLALSLP